jgi:hypothetical protein
LSDFPSVSQTGGLSTIPPQSSVSYPHHGSTVLVYWRPASALSFPTMYGIRSIFATRPQSHPTELVSDKVDFGQFGNMEAGLFMVNDEDDNTVE